MQFEVFSVANEKIPFCMEQVRPPSRFDVKQCVRKTSVCVCALMALFSLTCGVWLLLDHYNAFDSHLVSGRVIDTPSSGHKSSSIEHGNRNTQDIQRTGCLDELAGNDSGVRCFKKKQLRLTTVSFLLENISSKKKRTKHHRLTGKMASQNKPNQAGRNLRQSFRFPNDME